MPIIVHFVRRRWLQHLKYSIVTQLTFVNDKHIYFEFKTIFLYIVLVFSLWNGVFIRFILMICGVSQCFIHTCDYMRTTFKKNIRSHTYSFCPWESVSFIGSQTWYFRTPLVYEYLPVPWRLRIIQYWPIYYVFFYEKKIKNIAKTKWHIEKSFQCLLGRQMRKIMQQLQPFILKIVRGDRVG